MTEIPLSSFNVVPLSAATRERLIDLGVEVETIDEAPRTEAWGQSMITIAAPEEGEPSCFRRAYESTNPLCCGCTWMPKCWPHGYDYAAGPPPGVPPEVFARHVPAPEPRKRLPAPPPPPRR